MRLIFIRHGQTTGDIEDRYGGMYDDLLSPLGEQQVHQLTDELPSRGIDKVFTSPLKRAQQTAQGIVQKIGCPIVVVDGLRERDQYGVLTGMVKAEARGQYPELVEKLKDRLNTLPNAESYADASARMTKAYADILSQTNACSAIIWHGGGMRVLFRDILKVGELSEIGDCSWVELEYVSPSDPFIIKQTKRITFM